MDNPSELASTGYAHDCGNATCDICTLAPLPGEERAHWIWRLQVRFLNSPLPMTDWERQHMEDARRIGPCPVCGKPRSASGPCIGCVARNRVATPSEAQPAPVAPESPRASTGDAPLLNAPANEPLRICHKCGEPKTGHRCAPCFRETMRVNRALRSMDDQE